jgi:hypothetical protein
LRRQYCTFPETVETRDAIGSFHGMYGKHHQIWTGQFRADREFIRVELPQSHAEITAALRRAFEAAAEEPTDRDFAALLARLD